MDLLEAVSLGGLRRTALEVLHMRQDIIHVAPEAISHLIHKRRATVLDQVQPLNRRLRLGLMLPR